MFARLLSNILYYKQMLSLVRSCTAIPELISARMNEKRLYRKFK